MLAASRPGPRNRPRNRGIPDGHARAARPSRRQTARAETASRESNAYQRLRALIVNGQLAPGSPLIETDVSARLGISRTPVRAALLRLQQEGFIRDAATSPGRRAIVAPLTADDLGEVFVMVGALEAAAAREAANLDEARRITLCARLDEANRGFHAALAQRPPALALAQDEHTRFHRLIVDAVAGPRLRAEMDVLAPQAERYQRVYSAATLYAFDHLATGHNAIVATLRKGDADAAEQAMRRDWQVTAEHHRELVAVLGERGTW